MPTTSLEHSVGCVLGQVDQVESVYAWLEGELLNVFTVIGDEDESVYDRIYSQERAVIHEFPNVHFDFNVIARRGRTVDEILGGYVPAWRRGDRCLDQTNT